MGRSSLSYRASHDQVSSSMRRLKQSLLLSLAEADRGELISADDVLRTFREID